MCNNIIIINFAPKYIIEINVTMILQGKKYSREIVKSTIVTRLTREKIS